MGSTNLTSPYYDDFDATKIFIEFYFVLIMLFKPRELTQLQTILQNQVTQFINHVFKDDHKLSL